MYTDTGLRSWDSERVLIYVDGALQFQRIQSGGPQNICGNPSKPTWTEEIEHLDVVLPDHVADTVNIRITTTLDGLPDDESFGIDNVRVSGFDPLWPRVDDFEYSFHGWTGTRVAFGVEPLLHADMFRSTPCGPSRVLGGFNVAGSGVAFEKTYAFLPPHTSLQIEFDFYFIDTYAHLDQSALTMTRWDNEQARLEVDDTLLWTSTFLGQPGGVNLCGITATDYIAHVVVPVQGHSASSVKLRFTTNLNSAPDDESFGIDNINIVPA